MLYLQIQGITDDIKLTDVACGSSHSVAWAVNNKPLFPAMLQPVPFATKQDPLGISELGMMQYLLSNCIIFGSVYFH